MITVEIDGVTKSFGSTQLFEDLSLELEDGRTYALLGRNGSGKTTLMNLMCTKYIPDSGVIKIMDEEAYENDKALSNICFMKDYIPAFEDMRISAILKYAERHYSNWNKELAQQLMKQFNLKKDKIYGLLSKGQQTAVGLIVGLCSNNRVLLLDEIYSGLDAVARKELYTIIMQEQERFARTLVLSSHLIDEMTNLFTDVLILDDGKIILNDTLDTVQVKARKLTGRKDIDDILSEKNVLGKTQVGTMTEIYVYDDISEKELSELRDRDYKISHMNLQELFGAMTTK